MFAQRSNVCLLRTTVKDELNPFEWQTNCFWLARRFCHFASELCACLCAMCVCTVYVCAVPTTDVRVCWSQETECTWNVFTLCGAPHAKPYTFATRCSPYGRNGTFSTMRKIVIRSSLFCASICRRFHLILGWFLFRCFVWHGERISWERWLIASNIFHILQCTHSHIIRNDLLVVHCYLHPAEIAWIMNNVCLSLHRTICRVRYQPADSWHWLRHTKIKIRNCACAEQPKNSLNTFEIFTQDKCEPMPL